MKLLDCVFWMILAIVIVEIITPKPIKEFNPYRKLIYADATK